MKNLLLILFVFTAFFASAERDITCTLEVESSTTYIEGSDINPGDVICLLAGNKDYLLFKDIHGSSDQPVTIINKDGAVVINTDHSYGVKFDNCSHIIFSGNGSDSEEYGIQIRRVGNGAGISVDNKSTNVEIEFVEISYTAIAGIYAKTEPYQGDCDNLVTRENFTMYDLSIHDCYLHDISDEGMYIGSSKYTGQTVYQCDEVVVLPHVIEGVEVYNNIVENTGWDGIQVSSAISDCSIHDNVVRNDSEEEEWGQMSGIIIGGGSKCDCYNNKIFDGLGDGIDVFGMGDMMIYNNLIVNAGKEYEPSNPDLYRHGIYIGYVDGAFTTGANFKIYANTIVSPKSFGITFNNSEASLSYFDNNLITNPGSTGSTRFINSMVGTATVSQIGNYLADNTSQAKFIDSSDDEYDLQPDSPAINIGKSLTNEGINFDIEGRFRPFHTYFDAGAYECHDPEAGIDEEIATLAPYPVPANDYIIVPVESGEDFTIIFVSEYGAVVYNMSYQNYGQNEVLVNVNDFSNGYYILNYTDSNGTKSWPVIKSDIK